MKELSLFTGAGGGLLASRLLGWRTVGYVENEKYCQKIIKARIRDGLLDTAPIFGDVEKFITKEYAKSYKGMVDIITAGPPCQPFSCAGKGKGEADNRNKIPAVLQIVKIVKPEWIFLENSPTLPTQFGLYFGKILKNFSDAGYNVAWKVLSAAECGAPHLRKRLWLVSHATQYRN